MKGILSFPISTPSALLRNRLFEGIGRNAVRRCQSKAAYTKRLVPEYARDHVASISKKKISKKYYKPARSFECK